MKVFKNLLVEVIWTHTDLKPLHYNYLCEKSIMSNWREFEKREWYKLGWLIMKRSHSCMDKDTLILLKPNDIQQSVAEWTPSSICLHRDTDMLHWLTEQNIIFPWFRSSKSIFSSSGIYAAFNSKWPIQK